MDEKLPIAFAVNKVYSNTEIETTIRPLPYVSVKSNYSKAKIIMIKIIIFLSYHAKIMFLKKMVLTKPQPLCLLVLDSTIPNVNCIITLRSTRFRAPVTVSSTVNVKNFNRFYIFFLFQLYRFHFCLLFYLY